LAERAGARQVVLFHHKPDRTDDALDRLVQRFAAAPVSVMVAAEGETLYV
jgi:phosphoribosyl 1,2-cyclic phosphodiesterase